MSIEFRLDLHLDELDARLAALEPAALMKAAEHVAGVSSQQVPIEEGTLLRSQQVHPDGDGAVSISYGTPYAAVQHERYDFRHEHGNAGFLGIPLVTEADTALAIEARTIADGLQ